jgi:hypothetical protein
MQAMEDFSLQGLRQSANAALSQVEPVMLVLASVVTWIALSATSSVLSGAYLSVSEKGKLGLWDWCCLLYFFSSRGGCCLVFARLATVSRLQLLEGWGFLNFFQTALKLFRMEAD